MPYAAESALVEKTIRQAGELLKNMAAEPLRVLSTEGKDIKLQADRDAEALIIEAFQKHSSYPILGEESGEHGTEFGGLFWVIDPVDGTMNFSRGNPICCISIALMEGSEPRLGAIYDFNRDELFMATDGGGATLNGRPMRVSCIREPGEAILSTGFPSKTDYSTEAIMSLVNRVQVFKKVRMIGSAAISLAWTACGRFDAYAEDDINLWDVAAGLLLIKEAGGNVEIKQSPRNRWAFHVRCACNPTIWRSEK